MAKAFKDSVVLQIKEGGDEGVDVCVEYARIKVSFGFEFSGIHARDERPWLLGGTRRARSLRQSILISVLCRSSNRFGSCYHVDYVALETWAACFALVVEIELGRKTFGFKYV